jgi:isopentenyl-diphosphate delta-isomerase
MLAAGKLPEINRLVERLQADGLIIHVNPLQEWFQPEGDRLRKAPIDTVKEVLEQVPYPIIVKEVGQGIGIKSLKTLLELPLLAVEFAAFGGTNFAKLELMRSSDAQKELFEPLSKVGEVAGDMTDFVNRIAAEGNVKTKSLIISGGIETFLDGYYLIRKSSMPAIYGQASAFLKHARGEYSDLQSWVRSQIKGLEMAYAYLHIRE